MLTRRSFVKLAILLLLLATSSFVKASENASEEKDALLRAVKFFKEQVATHGGYVYLYSSDLSLREAEGIPDRDTIWVQPPGTPTVGEAMLRAYEATGERECLEGALEAARALVQGQLHSGGWFYSVNFGDPEGSEFRRRDAQGRLTPDPTPPKERTGAGGWPLWRQRRFLANLSTLDDDVTFAALRLLIRVDAATDFQDEAIHDAATYGLDALLGIQYPNGGWSTSWDRFPNESPSEKLFPLRQANYPEDWPRTWPKDFTGCYVTNDELMSRGIDTLLLAAATYDDPRYLEAARRAGNFLLDAQLPDPQPAWAQQYDDQMRPVWGRAFEPPAITSRESLEILLSLIELYRATGDQRYLEPIPKALDYLRRSVRPDGQLSRFYELETNRPIYFKRGPRNQGHILTYSDESLASNYGFLIEPNFEEIEAEYRSAKAGQPAEPSPTQAPMADLAAEARRVIAALDDRGAWTEPGTVRDASGKKTEPDGGIIRSQTFAENVEILCRYLRASANPQ